MREFAFMLGGCRHAAISLLGLYSCRTTAFEYSGISEQCLHMETRSCQWPGNFNELSLEQQWTGLGLARKSIGLWMLLIPNEDCKEIAVVGYWLNVFPHFEQRFFLLPSDPAVSFARH